MWYIPVIIFAIAALWHNSFLFHIVTVFLLCDVCHLSLCYNSWKRHLLVDDVDISTNRLHQQGLRQCLKRGIAADNSAVVDFIWWLTCVLLNFINHPFDLEIFKEILELIYLVSFPFRRMLNAAENHASVDTSQHCNCTNSILQMHKSI